MSEIYNHSFLCTYQDIEDKNESDLCYKIQFLQAFNIDDYDSKKIEIITEKLYEELKNIDSFIKLLKKLNIKCRAK